MERITITEKFTCGHVGLNSIIPSSRSSQPSRNLWSRVRRLATSSPTTRTQSIQRDEPCSKCQAEQQRLKEANELDLQDLSHAADFWKVIHEAHIANGQHAPASRCELCLTQRYAFSVLCGGPKKNEALDEWNSSPTLSFFTENSSEVSQYHDAVSKQSTSFASSSSLNSVDQETFRDFSGVSYTGLTTSDNLLNLPALPEQDQDEITALTTGQEPSQLSSDNYPAWDSLTLPGQSEASSSISQSCHWTQRRIIDPDTAEGQLELLTSFYHGRRIIDPDTEGQSELQELQANGIHPSPILEEPRIIDPDTPEGQAKLHELDEAKARPIRAYFSVPDTVLLDDLPDYIEQKTHPGKPLFYINSQYRGRDLEHFEVTATALSHYIEASKASLLRRGQMVEAVQAISQQEIGPGKSGFWFGSDSDDEDDDAVSDVSLLLDDDDDESRSSRQRLEESWNVEIEDDLYDAKPMATSTFTEEQIAISKPSQFKWDDEDEEEYEGLSNTKTTTTPVSPISAAQERRNSAAETTLKQELTEAGYTSEIPDSVWDGPSTLLFDAEEPQTPTSTQVEFPPLPLLENNEATDGELFDIYSSYEDRTEPIPIVAPPRPERPEENLDELFAVIKEQEKQKAIEAAKPPMSELQRRRAAIKPSRLNQVVSAEELAEESKETWV
jgi:hypothetical protein